jgi:hypothetical protein
MTYHQPHDIVAVRQNKQRVRFFVQILYFSRVHETQHQFNQIHRRILDFDNAGLSLNGVVMEACKEDVGVKFETESADLEI